MHPPTDKNGELLYSFGGSVQIKVAVVPHSTDAQFKPLPSYRFGNGWDSKSKCEPLIELRLFAF